MHLRRFFARRALRIQAGILATSTWTERAIPNNRYWRSVCWSPELGIFVAVNYSSSACVMTSPDGINWTERTSGVVSRSWFSICWSAELGIFVAVNNSSSACVMTSPDGITWTERTSGVVSRNWISICWSPELGIFVAVNTGSAAVVLVSKM